MSKVLVLNCDMNNGTRKEYTINNPKTGLTLANAQATYDLLDAKNLFLVNGVKPTALIGAQYIETTVTELV